MNKIADEVVEKLLSNIDIVKVIEEDIDLKKAGKNYKGLCPFHNDTNPSFFVSPQKQICKCFVCGTGGDAISYYMKSKNVGFEQSVIELSKKYDIDLGINLEEKVFEENDKYYIIMKEAHKYFTENIFEHREPLEYLSKRGYDTDTIKQHKIGYASQKWSELYDYLHSKGYTDKDLLELGLIKQNEKGKFYDTFRNRIIFPIFSASNHIIAFGGRTLEKDATVPKYINSPDTPIFKKSYNLFGIEQGYNIKNKNYSILMEGYIDVLTAKNYNIDTCVAPLGTALTLEQAKLLKKYSNNVLLCFDNDNAGVLATEKAILLLKSQGFNIKVIEYIETKDPDDFFRTLGREKFLEKVKSSTEAFDFIYNTHIKEYDIENNIIAKDNFIKSFIDFFSILTEEVEKELYLQKLSEKVKVSIEVLKKTLIANNKTKFNFETLEEHPIDKKINEIELKVLKVLLQKPDYISLFEDEISLISRSDLFNKTVNFIKNNLETDDLVKEYRNFTENNELFSSYKEEIATIIMDCIITDSDRTTNEIIKSFFRFKIKEIIDVDKKKNLIQPVQKKEFLQISKSINLSNNFNEIFFVNNKLNLLIKESI